MGRSKFPGKPSKHIFKKRVNVIPPNGETSNLENIVCGTATLPTIKEQINNEDICDNGSESSVINYKLAPRTSNVIDNCKVKKRRKSKKNLISTLRANGFKSKLRNIQKTRKIIAKKSESIKMQFTRSAFESKSIVGKFVLPSRSIHSSRVIKPNKRFINVEVSETTSLKRKILNKALCAKNSKGVNAKRMSEKSKYNTMTERISKKRVILRQARLKLQAQNMVKPVGPFSSSIDLGATSGTVTCGVCGAVRFYRFIKQARKFNIYSCESCRKFISKIIKRQSCKSTSSRLVCHKGHGMCHVPPIVKSQQCELTRSAYRARCPACWLKMCLRSFQMPLTLKNGLIQLLPENMQDLSSFANINNNNNTNTDNNNTVEECEQEVNESKKKPENKRLTPVVKRLMVPLKNIKAPSSNPSRVPVDLNVKRQKVTVKGPRVKHVCRSASIVLGQQIATFPIDKKKIIESQDSASIESNKKKGVPEALKSRAVAQISEIDVEKLGKNTPDSIKPNVPSTQEDSKRQKGSITSSVVALPSKPSLKHTRSRLRNKISIDYWKNYDQSGTTEKGYCLIATEQFSISAVCYLCGSAGKDTLLYCMTCCEPYHLFCLDQSQFLYGMPSKENTWLCPKCTVCNVCNQTNDKKMQCQKCCKTYHPQCLNTQTSSDVTSMVCSECMLCKCCGSASNTDYIVNSPLCETCFKMEGSEKKCPLCHNCYSEHETKSEIIECGDCKNWIHLKCEKINEDYLAILGTLPDPLGYICDMCSKHTTPYWNAAVYFKLNVYFNNILRQLSENRSTRNLLKWNLSNSSNKINILKKLHCLENSLELDTISSAVVQSEIKEDLLQCDNFNDQVYEELPFGIIRSKVYAKLYKSIREFNSEMEEILICAGSEQLFKQYQLVLNKTFPQFANTKTHINPIKPKEVKDLIVPQKDIIHLNFISYDTRFCILCKQNGDGLDDRESRLLYCGSNEWIHANCAIWSTGVYENINGFLKNIHIAVSRGKTTCCTFCKQMGATLDCAYKDCSKVYHFHCAQEVDCKFHHTKLIFCSSHSTNPNLVVCTDFYVCRPIYIEKNDTRSYSEIEKVNVMIGSLRINSLGKVNSVLSDSNEAIIPIGFKCSRLFWSTVEPWKVISYSIMTSTGNYNAAPNNNTDIHFTVNHSLPTYTVNQKLKEMNQWLKDIDRRYSTVDFEEEEEENQNSVDLLIPEITDAIFEELPHDLLDRISVQDLFPKLASYDDLIINDLKPEENFLNPNLISKYKLEDNVLTKYGKSEKDCKSESSLKGNKDKFNDTKSQKCSVTVNCKVNRSDSPVAKKRKVASKQNILLQTVQLDGHSEGDSDNSLKLFFKQFRKYGKLLQLDGNVDDGFEYFFDTSGRRIGNAPEEPVTCTRCHCTYRTTTSYNKHLDSCEVVSSESDSEVIDQDNHIATFNITHIPNSTLTSPEKTSYNIPFIDYSQAQAAIPQVNLPKELIFIPDKQRAILSVKTSDAKSLEVQGNAPSFSIVNPANNQITPLIFTQSNSVDTLQQQANHIGQPIITFTNENKAQSNANHLPVYSNQTAPSNLQLIVNSSIPQMETMNVLNGQCVGYQNPTISVHQNDHGFQPVSISTQPLNISASQPVSISTQPLSISASQPVSISTQPLNISASQPVSLSNQPVSMSGQVSIGGQPVTISAQPVSLSTQPVSITNQQGQPIQYVNNVNSYVNLDSQSLGLNGKVMNNSNLINGQILGIITQDGLGKNNDDSFTVKNSVNKQNETYILQQNNPPTVVLQNIPSTNYVSFIAHNYQQEDCKNSIQQQMAPIAQIQPDNTISIIPSIQPTVMLQQPQYIIDNNIPLTFTQQPVQQPMYYGFETIIQNTVMASQQILPSAVPGVITANSSYSTTTQVFQTSSKLEPMLEVPQNALVVVSSGQIIGTVPLQMSYTQAATPQFQVSTVNEVNPHTVKQDNINSNHNKTKTNNANSITLPTAPLVMKKEQGIPTNVVAPNPKVANRNFRPMNRVLPMKKNVTLKKNEDVDKPVIKEREIKDMPVISMTESENKYQIKKDTKIDPEIIKVKDNTKPNRLTDTVQRLKPSFTKETTNISFAKKDITNCQMNKKDMFNCVVPKKDNVNPKIVKTGITQKHVQKPVQNNGKGFNITTTLLPFLEHKAKSDTPAFSVSTEIQRIKSAPPIYSKSPTSSVSFKSTDGLIFSKSATPVYATSGTPVYATSRTPTYSTSGAASHSKAQSIGSHTLSQSNHQYSVVQCKVNGEPKFSIFLKPESQKTVTFPSSTTLHSSNTVYTANSSIQSAPSSQGKSSQLLKRDCPKQDKKSQEKQHLNSEPVRKETVVTTSDIQAVTTSVYSSSTITSVVTTVASARSTASATISIPISSALSTVSLCATSSPIVTSKVATTASAAVSNSNFCNDEFLINRKPVNYSSSNFNSNCSNTQFLINRKPDSNDSCVVSSYSNTEFLVNRKPATITSASSSSSSCSSTKLSVDMKPEVNNSTPNTNLSCFNSEFIRSIKAAIIASSAATSSCSSTDVLANKKHVPITLSSVSRSGSGILSNNKPATITSASASSSSCTSNGFLSSDISATVSSASATSSNCPSPDTLSSKTIFTSASASSSRCSSADFSVNKKPATITSSSRGKSTDRIIKSTKSAMAASSSAMATSSSAAAASSSTMATSSSTTCANTEYLFSATKSNSITRKRSAEKILYTIETKDGFQYSSTNLSETWTKVAEAVQNARVAHNMPVPPPKPSPSLNGFQLLGLNTDTLKYLIEQLPGAGKCSKYEPSFGFSPAPTESEDEVQYSHNYYAIRCAPYPYNKNHERHDMFGWLASKHREPEYNSVDPNLLPRRNSVKNLPITMKFRQLKQTSKYSVGVYRSKIHRRGLFCLRDIEAGEMVIEYAGEVIRSILCDKREKYYNSKGIGCYMFRVDDNLVIDATMKGNAARFINHSCEPNCYSKVVEIFGHKHIIIFALRKILFGEELTYDYKFPFEEDKIPCTCGSKKCRKFLN